METDIINVQEKYLMNLNKLNNHVNKCPNLLYFWRIYIKNYHAKFNDVLDNLEKILFQIENDNIDDIGLDKIIFLYLLNNNNINTTI